MKKKKCMTKSSSQQSHFPLNHLTRSYSLRNSFGKYCNNHPVFQSKYLDIFWTHRPSPHRRICSFTPYKSMCCSAFLSSVSATRTYISGEYISPEKIIILSFQLGDTKFTRPASFVNFTKPEEFSKAASVLQQCQVLLNKEMSPVNSVVFGMDLCSFTNENVNDNIEWLNRIETHQRACLDGLEMSGSTLTDEAKSNVQ